MGMDPRLTAMLPLKVAQEEVVGATMLEMSSGSLAGKWHFVYILLLRLQLGQIYRLICRPHANTSSIIIIFLSYFFHSLLSVHSLLIILYLSFLRFCGGLILDVKRKLPFFASDFYDGLHIQALSATLFIYLGTVTNAITFGGLLGDATENMQVQKIIAY